MKKDLFLLSLLLTAVVFSGCVGAGFNQRYYCNRSTANDGGRLTEGYMPSNGVAPQFMNGVAPYQGAPVRVVNGSDVIYGATNGAPNGAAAGAGVAGGMPAGADGQYAYAQGNDYYARGFGWGAGGRLDDGTAARAWMGRRVGAGMGGRRSARYDDQIWNRMNPYDHPNTPTRSPRDFFAPNPPSIGP